MKSAGFPRSAGSWAVSPPSTMTAHFRIGVVSVTLVTSVRDVFDDFCGLYQAHRAFTADPGAIVVEVRRRWGLRTRACRVIRVPARGFDILTDHERRFTVYRSDAVLPHVEWALNAAIAATLSGYYQLHAGVVSRDGAALLFPAYPQSGKSTLVARLVSRGWDYLSDEFGLIDPAFRTVWPYPKAICIKHGSFPVLERSGLRLESCREYDKGFKGRVKLISAQQIRPHETPVDLPVRMVVFPRFAGRIDPIVSPVSQAQAVFRMLGASFSFSRFRAQAVFLLAELVRRATCLQVESGDLDRTCDAIERQWEKVLSHARCVCGKPVSSDEFASGPSTILTAAEASFPDLDAVEAGGARTAAPVSPWRKAAYVIPEKAGIQPVPSEQAESSVMMEEMAPRLRGGDGLHAPFRVLPRTAVMEGLV